MKQKDPEILEKRRVKIVRLLHHLREKYNLTNGDIADMMEVNRQTLSHISLRQTHTSLLWIHALLNLIRTEELKCSKSQSTC